MSAHPNLLDEPKSEGFLSNIPVILWQRRWWAIPPVVIMSTLGLIAALLLPTVYRSTATLLVESQELPTAVADAGGSNVIDQRIAKIRQQVLSRGELIGLIEQNDLYVRDRKTEPLSQIVESMRTAVSVQAVANDIGAAPTQGSNTVAFTLSYDYRDPLKAQAVMQRFVSRFLEIDTSGMADRANSAVSFLQDQTATLQSQINAIEQQITDIKRRNGLALASTGAMSMPTNGSYDMQIAQLRNQNQALALQGRRSTADPMITAAQAQLEAARAIYSESHPDVVAAKAHLAQLKQTGVSGTNRSEDVAAAQAQITANNEAIAGLERARASDASRASASLSAAAQGPAVMEQVTQLENHTLILRQQYQEATANLLKAQNSMRMAQEQKGEHLTIVDPPSLPDKPISPNRPLLIAGGIVAGLGIGLVLSLLVELLLRPVRSIEAIENLGLMPLAVIPELVTDGMQSKRSWRLLRRRQDADPECASVS